MGGPSREEREAEARARENERRLEEERRAAQAQATQFIQIASQPDELEEKLKQRDLGWLNWESGSAGPRDVMKAPLGAGLDLYSSAINRQQGERRGTGALQLGAQGSNPMLAQLLSQQSNDMRQQEASGGLERAVRMRSAEVNRSALPLAEFGQDRRMGLAGLMSNNANAAAGNAANASSAYLNFLMRPRRPSIWHSILQAGGQAGAAKIQFGCVVLDTRLLTPSGYVPIANLTEGNLVMAVDRFGQRSPQPIVRERLTPESDILRIENTDGGIVECSPSDRIMFSEDDRSETFASELVEGQQVAGTTIKSIEKLSEKKPVKIVKVGSIHENFGLIDEAGFWHLDDYAVMGAT